MEFSLQHQLIGSTYTLKIIGILDYSTIDDFNATVNIPLQVTACVLDFSQLEFIDSTGIGGILNLIYFTNDRGTALQFIGLNPEVQEIFETIGVFKIIEALSRGNK